MSKIEKTNTDKITLDNFPRTKKSFKNLLATNDLLNTIERTSKFTVIENQIHDKITVDEPTIVAEIETNRPKNQLIQQILLVSQMPKCRQIKSGNRGNANAFREKRSEMDTERLWPY
jgi:hypothetical protein